MLRVCVVMGVLAAAVCAQWSLPLPRSLLPAMSPPLSKFSTLRTMYGAKPKRTSSVTDTVVWLPNCSPRQAFVSSRQDAQLQCEAVVPSGTEVTWYKNHQPILRPGDQEPQMTQVQQEAYEETTNEIGLPLVPAAAPSGTRLRVSSLVYIDCADQTDQAEYSMEMRTPANNVYFRNFTVRVMGVRPDGSTCHQVASQRERQPRLHYFTLWAWPIAGGSLTLPCRAQGTNLQYTWYVDNIYVGNTNPNYQVLANGDLIIRSVGTNTPNSGRCQVSSTDGSGPMDAITTNIRVRSQ